MFTFLTTVIVVVFLLLLCVLSVQPTRTTFSLFELQRRSLAQDKDAKIILRREQLLSDVLSLQRVITAFLLVVTALLCVSTFNWLFGTLIAFIIAIEYSAIARLPVLQKQSQKIYERIEKTILVFIEKHPYIFALLRNMPSENGRAVVNFGSREELQHLISQSSAILSSEEKKLIINSLSFNDRLISSIMTLQSAIDGIKKSEFLGPLMLDEMHKTGHSHLPVFSNDLNHIIGVLHLQSLLALDVKRSLTAEKAMDHHVFYICEDQTLQHALAAFLRTHAHLFIVVNELRETVGLITFTDVIEALLGRKIIDEFDNHDDLRQVALRNPRGNNHPEKREDV